MGKLVMLKFAGGNLTKGFPVTLQISNENAQATVEITGELPPIPELEGYYQAWQSIYLGLRLASRPIGLSKQTAPKFSLEDCYQATEKLTVCFNHWLAAESFRGIREKCLEKLSADDEIRIIIQTQDIELQKLPWHIWDLLERYPQAEIAFSTPSYEKVNQVDISGEKVKILAILGNSQGIDLTTDREILQQLPNADITFLVEPERRDISDRLWESNWKILFFAGHSATQSPDTGKIYINQTESLTISELKYALKKAVARGLQLAIFNSCDGLGLAREFADLQIPQIIVMREPVADKVAQEFLKHFLAAFARGESLYLSVREARERLQGLENRFPCASWLPAIYQNPAQIPRNWQEFMSAKNPSLNQHHKQLTQQPVKHPLKLGWGLLTSAIATGLIMGIRYLGILQPLELTAFDQMMRSRPQEAPDSRILVVTVTEEDVAAQAAENPRGSLSEQSLEKLIDRLQVHQPVAIGLDIYRDYPVSKNHPQLTKNLQNTSNLVAVCRVQNTTTKKPAISPPPEVSLERLGFSNVVVDADHILRRHYLALTPPPSSDCQASYALSVQLALRYLYTKGIQLEYTNDGAWLLGNLKFSPIESHSGGYQGIDALGHQILLNYRSAGGVEGIATKITLTEALSGTLNPNAIKDKIIIIGTTAESFHDYWLTPYTNSQTNSQSIPGVILQAQMVSQLLSAALDGRPTLKTISFSNEIIWIWCWAVIGGLLAIYLQRFIYWGFATGICILFLYGTSLILLITPGFWIPVIPSLFSLIASGVVIQLSQIYALK